MVQVYFWFVIGLTILIRCFVCSFNKVTPENNSNDNSSECSSKSVKQQMDMSCPRPVRRKPPSCTSSSSSLPIEIPCACKLQNSMKFFKVIIAICTVIDWLRLLGHCLHCFPLFQVYLFILCILLVTIIVTSSWRNFISYEGISRMSR